MNAFIQTVLVFWLFLTGVIHAQSQENIQAPNHKTADQIAIRAMGGCYDVEFKYTETFAPEADYEKAYDYTSAAFEYAHIVEDSEDKIVIQHLLILHDSMIIKHWRQDWTYEKNNVYRYDREKTWLYQPLDSSLVKGKWTQEVYQVDDSPRYTGTATWTHVDRISSWYNKADSPLPRREYSKRNDYNIMKRGNRVQILKHGWLHEQDNDKVIRAPNKEDILLTQEKGYNIYKKRKLSDCQVAIDWWAENENKWALVREVWDDIYTKNTDLHLETKVEGKRLYEHLFYGESYNDKAKIENLLKSYLLVDVKN
ncbi:MAG: hypothetical protein ACI9FN_002944 [Saprospiraceae bacterium]|jgi:hypothetical protein